jgi:hypothetical protein
MKVKAVTAALLIACGAISGCFAFFILLISIWARDDSWFYYVGLAGCPIMIVGGIISFKNLKVGSIVGFAGYVLMLFCGGPAIVFTIRSAINSKDPLNGQALFIFCLLLLLLLLTLIRLILNIRREVTNGFDSQRDRSGRDR